MTTKNDAPADPGATPAPQTDAPPEGAPAADAPPATPPAPEPDYKALAEKWERQAKNDRSTLDGLKKSMQGLLTPEQVATQQQQAAQTERERDEARVEALKLRVALDKGLPPAMADRLIGTTREELEKDAATVLSMIPPTPPPSRVPDAGAGTGRATAPPTQDLNSLLRTAAGVTT